MSTSTDLQTGENPLKSGLFKDIPSSFRDFIQPGGRFPPEKGRYHLYIANVCPFANRATIVRHLKGLEDLVDVTVLYPCNGPKGWAFAKAEEYHQLEGAQEDLLYGFSYLKEIYEKAYPGYDGRVTVPVLWDKKGETIVNNESSEILRIFNSGFNSLLPPNKAALDFYPKDLQAEINELNEWVYDTVNMGVYKVGFSRDQQSYEGAVKTVFDSLDKLEVLLGDKQYLVGGRLTEADIRLFTTIVRFDVAYHGAFKCNIGSIRHNYPHINSWLKRLYWKEPGFKVTINFEHIKFGYYKSHKLGDANATVPVGPRPYVEPL